jgi:hypothetical protein
MRILLDECGFTLARASQQPIESGKNYKCPDAELEPVQILTSDPEERAKFLQ